MSEYFRFFFAKAPPGHARFAPAVGTMVHGDVIYSPTRNCKLVFEPDGNLVLYGIDVLDPPADITKASYSKVLWESATSGSGGSHVSMQNDGNLVIYSGGIPPPPSGLGSSANYSMVGPQGSTWLTGIKVTIEIDETIELARNVATGAVWASDTPGNPGAYLRVQDDGNLVIEAANGTPITSSAVYVASVI